MTTPDDRLREALAEAEALISLDERDLAGWVPIDDALAQARLNGQRAAIGWLRNRLGARRPTPAAPQPDHESWCHREHVGHCVDGPATAHPSTPAAPQPDTALTADDAECPTCSGHFHHMWPCPAIQRCEVHGCDREADCGTPTDDGYKRVCGRHFAEFLALGDKP